MTDYAATSTVSKITYETNCPFCKAPISWVTQELQFQPIVECPVCSHKFYLEVTELRHDVILKPAGGE